LKEGNNATAAAGTKQQKRLAWQKGFVLAPNGKRQRRRRRRPPTTMATAYEE
jgi:hypothetical protein